MTDTRFVFVPLGSTGDVNPLVWLARLMAERGHEVTMVVQAAMADHPRRAGVPFVAVGDASQQEAITRSPDLWHPRRGFALLARYFPEWGREMVPRIREVVVPGRTVLIGPGIALGLRMVAEADGVPTITTHLQPSIFLSPQDGPVLMAGMERFKSCPLWLRRFVVWLGGLETDRVLRRPVNRIRAELGLRRPARGILTDWAVSKDLVLALFPDWFAPPQPDWPTPTRVTRFPLYDEAGARSADPGLEAFLQSGDPPILLTPGSANQQARRFFTVGLEACWKLGKRALLVTPFREQLPASLPSGAAHFSFVPFGHVFSRCAAVLHHGGIGTCAQGMAAGVPQFLMPMGFDQPDNAWRLRRLGVGDYLYPAKFEPDAVARRLGLLLESEIVARACRDVAEKMRTQMPPADVARILEQFPVQAGK